MHAALFNTLVGSLVILAVSIGIGVKLWRSF